MEVDLGLRAHCHINKNEEDKFVGIKSSNEQIMVFFPLGYDLPKTDEGVRKDIIQLIAVLSDFAYSMDKIVLKPQNDYSKSVNFPISAYINIIRYFLEQGTYYSEKEKVRSISDRGKIDWPASLKRNVSFYQKDGTPFFNNYIVRGATPNENNMITMIHKYCVYEAFKKLGWIFTGYLPQDPHIILNKNLFLAILKKKRANIFNDKDKLLFEAMISMLEYTGDKNDDKQFYFGTNRFEYVWEKLIDRIFGIPNKEEFFPRTKWQLKYADRKNNYVLEPDTIMEYNGKIYVLDAKYYRYGVTGNPTHMPSSTSINKQITYGEYVYMKEDYEEKYGKKGPVYNAFLMPYNMRQNPFNISGEYENVGEATSEWKTGEYPYENVQGIVVDVRSLMYTYRGSGTSKISEMANAIDAALKENRETSLIDS